MLNFVKRIFGGQPEPASIEANWLVVGLGNPGAQYEATRHNVGYMALDELVGSATPLQAPGIAADYVVEKDVLYMRSRTYMNTSGTPVAKLAKVADIAPERIIVIHDELDLAPGRVKLRLGGNENGHNGLKSISEHLGTRDYVRVRIGIGRPPAGVSVSDYVLGPVEDIDEAVTTAAHAVRLIMDEGLEKAQHQIHRRS